MWVMVWVMMMEDVGDGEDMSDGVGDGDGGGG